MEIQGFFTKKGLELSAKLLTGAALTITHVAAGSGHTADPAAAVSLPQLKQELAVNSPVRRGATVSIPVTLAAAQAGEDYDLTELGVYAQDPDEGEILYKLYRLDAPVSITAGSQTVLRFYLQETVSRSQEVTVVCSPAGLVTEADFEPVRQVVQSCSAPGRVVYLEAAELQDYLFALPRLMTEHLVIQVSGTLEGELLIENYYGSGSLTLQAATLGDFVVNGFGNSVRVMNCAVRVNLYRIKFQVRSEVTSYANAVYYNNSVGGVMNTCQFTGNGTTGSAIVVGGPGVAVALLECPVSGFQNAVRAEYGAMVSVFASSAEAYTGNTIGALLSRGAVVLLSGAAPSTLGGASNSNNGGVLVRAFTSL